MNELFIIGNGFDMSHGLKSSYNDFRRWFEKKYFSIGLREIQKWSIEMNEESVNFPTSTYNYDGEEEFNEDDLARFFYYIMCSTNNIQDWSNFENNLGTIPCESFYYDDINCDNDFAESVNNQNQGELCGKAIISAVNTFFYRWISETVNPNIRTLSPISKLIMDKPTAFYLNFNYTTVLQQVYNIDSSQICHIHGCYDKNDKLIIGHGLEINPYDSETSNYNDVFNDSASYYATRYSWYNLQKNTKAHMEKHKNFFSQLESLDCIYCLGFNLSPSNIPDRYYLKEIFSNHTSENTIFYIDDFKIQDKYFPTARNLTQWGFNGKIGLCYPSQGICFPQDN